MRSLSSMKTWVVVAVLAVGPLSACGPSKELRQVRSEASALRTETESLRAEVRVLRAENKTLKAKVGDLEDSLIEVSQERDELKLAAERPAPAPSRKSGRK
jgi:uncharacterized protein YlxW (UPF0749 family)